MPIIHIRPYQLLTVPDNFGERVTFFMPSPEATGSLTVIEFMMLLKLMRCVNPAYLFEFGTYKGQTTRLLLENLPDADFAGSRLFTLDLRSLEGVHFQGEDQDLATVSMTAERKYLTSPNGHLVHQILCELMQFDPEEFRRKCQFIFIDANHELSYVRRDTENAMEMLAPEPSCVVWHDYGNPQYPELTAYLDGLADEMPLYHIGDTMLAFHLRGQEVGATHAPSLG